MEDVVVVGLDRDFLVVVVEEDEAAEEARDVLDVVLDFLPNSLFKSSSNCFRFSVLKK